MKTGSRPDKDRLAPRLSFLSVPYERHILRLTHESFTAIYEA